MMKAMIFLLSSLGLLGSAHFDKNKPKEWRNQVIVLAGRLDLLAGKFDKSSTAVLESCKVAMMTLLERFQKYKTKLETTESELKRVKDHSQRLERTSCSNTVAVDFETMEELAGEKKALAWFNGFAEEFIKKP
jgi:hypothetical protein